MIIIIISTWSNLSDRVTQGANAELDASLPSQINFYNSYYYRS